MHRTRVTFWYAHASLAILVLSATFCSNLLGESEPSTSSEAREADEELNRNYQQAMRALAPKSQEELRKAQRAWLVFVERNSAAIRAAARKRGTSLEQCDELELQEVRDRASDLSSLSRNGPRADEANYGARLPRQDAELNSVYQRCLHSLEPEEAEKLREAQRAWIAFRDASRNRGAEFLYELTQDRIEQINNFYIGTGNLSGREDEKAESDKEEKVDPTTPDPFERARAPHPPH